MRAPLPIIGDAYKNLSLELSAQTLKNWYVEVNPKTSKPISLQPFPGRTEFASGGAEGGGLFTWRGKTYKVSGSTFFSYDAGGTGTSIGTIEGTGQCTFVASYDVMIIARNGHVYSYDGNTLTKGTDPDLESPDFVAYLNEQTIYDGDGNRFGVSNPGSLTSVDGLNYAEAESSDGVLIRPYVFNELLFLMKTDTIESWYNSGVGNPPMDRIQNGIIEMGLKEGHSVSSNKGFMYWLGSDSNVYRTTGSGLEPVSTVPVAREFFTYNTTGAIGICFNLRGQEFYRIYFPEEERTWCFCETGSWFELTTGNSEAGDNVTAYTENYGKKLVEVGGSIYSLDDSAYTNDGQTIIRERVSDKVSAELFGQQYAGLEVTYNRVEIVAKTRALILGQGSSPTLFLAFSDDHGRTWTEISLTGASAGEYIWRFQAFELGSSYERLFRLRISDPVWCSVESAAADVELSLA